MNQLVQLNGRLDRSEQDRASMVGQIDTLQKEKQMNDGRMQELRLLAQNASSTKASRPKNIMDTKGVVKAPNFVSDATKFPNFSSQDKGSSGSPNIGSGLSRAFFPSRAAGLLPFDLS